MRRFIKFPGWGGGSEKRESPDFRSPEVGISAMDSAIERLNTLARTVFSNHGSKFFRKERGKTNVACLKKI